MELDYDRFNELLYRRKWVGYSWFRRDIGKLEGILRKRGFETERIKKGDWEEVDFVRDGSFLILEDTVVIKKGGKFAGFVTPTKLIFFEGMYSDGLKKFYRFPLNPGTALYGFSLLLSILAYVMWFM